MKARAMTIDEAKKSLSLPELMHLLGLGEHAKKSARCPFHDDRRNSFSVWQCETGTWLWKCHAGCGWGDEITFLELHEKLSPKDAIKRYLELAGVNGSESRKPFVAARTVEQRTEVKPNDTPTATPQTFDWPSCVESFTAAYALRLTLQRKHSVKLYAWLKENGLIGLYDGCVAFPVHDREGKVVACHYRLKDGTWLYYPLGTKVRPLVIGELIAGDPVESFESYFDAISFMHVSGKRSGIIITRGAGNGALIAGLVPARATVYAWKQNDELKNGKRAADEWLKDVASHAGVKVLWAKTREEFKDLNDWTRAGATADDILAAMMNAELVRQIGKAEYVRGDTTPGVDLWSKGDAQSKDSGNGEDETIARLAALPVLEYERCREAEADKLCCRVSVLDGLVEASRPKNRENNTPQGKTLKLADVEPWPEPVNGAEILDKIAQRLEHYVVLPQGAADMLALWCAHTNL